MRLVILAGGVGGARFLLGARRLLGLDTPEARESSPHRIDAVVNVGDDAWMHGVRITPDLDTCMYTLGGGIDSDRGWGHADETWNCQSELAAYGVQPDWFGLGDKDLATHLVRTQMLNAGYRLTDITEALSARWSPGVRLLPVTDDRCETHVVVTGGEVEDDGDRAIHFQEWWVRYRASLVAKSFVQVGAAEASPTPEVTDALENADAVLIAPSNPVVSVGSMLAVSGMRAALRRTSAPVVGVSPVIAGGVLRGMADSCLSAIGVETSARGVAAHYGARSGTGLLDGWLVATGDGAEFDNNPVDGVAVREAPLLMSGPDHTAAMVAAALELGGLDTSITEAG